MKVCDNSTIGRIPVGEVSLGHVFRHKNLFYMRCASPDEKVLAKSVLHGSNKSFENDTLVLPEPDAVMYIGPHPDAAKLKKLVSKLKAELGKAIKCSGCVIVIRDILNEMEADDGN